MFAALMLSVAVSFALPACPSNGYFHNCFSTYDFANGDKYVGQWNGSKKNGLGAYTFTNGNKYVGDWNDDKKNGQGTFIWPDGKKYVGEWKDNRFQYGSKTPPPLLTAFINLSKDNRKKPNQSCRTWAFISHPMMDCTARKHKQLLPLTIKKPERRRSHKQ